jgi:hypothetical protein
LSAREFAVQGFGKDIVLFQVQVFAGDELRDKAMQTDELL